MLRPVDRLPLGNADRKPYGGLMLVAALVLLLFQQPALGQTVEELPQRMPVSSYLNAPTDTTTTNVAQPSFAAPPTGTVSPLPPLTNNRLNLAQSNVSPGPDAIYYNNGTVISGTGIGGTGIRGTGVNGAGIPGTANETWIMPPVAELHDFGDPMMSGPPIMVANVPTEPIINGFLFHGYSGWRGISEGSGNNNNGFSYGGSMGAKLGHFSDLTGIGLQLGASYGLYDLNGRASGFASAQYQQQSFVTVGLFRKADSLTNFAFGAVFDAMINENFGQFAVSPFLGQMRAQIAYCLDERHELGFWTAIRLIDDSRDVSGPLNFRGVDQFNFFWHHKFDFGGDSWTWFGFPDPTKLGGNGSLGSYIWGGTLTVPLSPRWGAYTDLQYMAPSAHTSAVGSMEETFYLGVGVTFYPGRNSRQDTVMGQRWMPYMPVANNGVFMVDSNRTF